MLDSSRIGAPLLLAAVVGAVSLVGGLLSATGAAPQAQAAQASPTSLRAAHSGHVLDVAGASETPGAPVIQWPPNGGGNQSWTFEDLGDGTYRIVVGHTGQVLDVIQWPWNGGDNQRWRLEDLPEQGSRIVAVHSGLALDVAGALQDPGVPVIQWHPNGGDNQRWQRTAEDDGPVRLTESCVHEERGVTIDVQYPEGWHVNDPSVEPCTSFDPQPFAVEPGTQIPRDRAIVLRVEPLSLDRASSATGLRIEDERSTTVDGRPAVRQEVVTTGEALGPAGDESTRYVVDGGAERVIIASTYDVEGNDYEASVEVLDAMAEAFAIEPLQDGGGDGDGDGGDGRLHADDVLSPGIDTTRDVGESAAPMVSVTDVRLGRHHGFDRIVFEIGGGGEAGWEARYVDEARAAGSGFVVDVDGEAILQVSLRNIALPPAAPAGVEPWDGPERLGLEGAGPVVEVVESTLYEGVHTFFVGLTDTLPFQVVRFDSPQRVVLDVAAS